VLVRRARHQTAGRQRKFSHVKILASSTPTMGKQSQIIIFPCGQLVIEGQI
jgi:hypothetical protein